LQTFGLEFGIQEGAIFTLDTFPGGYLYAGSEGGYILFHPDSVVDAAHLPKLSIWKASLLGVEEPDTLVNPEKLILDYPRNGIEIVLSVKPAWLATVFSFRYRDDRARYNCLDLYKRNQYSHFMEPATRKILP
jgi:hypothetical protein